MSRSSADCDYFSESISNFDLLPVDVKGKLNRDRVRLQSSKMVLPYVTDMNTLWYKGITFPLQVSTSTGVKSHYFNLHVMVPTAFILGSDEYHTQAGNAISLVCIIENVGLDDTDTTSDVSDTNLFVFAESRSSSIRILVPQRKNHQL